MKSITKTVLLTFSVLVGFTTFCANAADDTQTPNNTLSTAEDVSSYAIGLSFADYLNAQLIKPAQVGLKLNREIILKGLIDGFMGQSQLSDRDKNIALNAFEKSLEKKVSGKSVRETPSTKALPTGMNETASGVRYSVISLGTGQKPTLDSVVTVQYMGTLEDGTVFDSSYARGQPAVFKLTEIISGLAEGITLMPTGSTFQFTIPPERAYGQRGANGIPPNSTLVFNIELLNIQ